MLGTEPRPLAWSGFWPAQIWARFLKMAQRSSLLGEDTGCFLDLQNEVWGWDSSEPQLSPRVPTPHLPMGEGADLTPAQSASPARKGAGYWVIWKHF